MKIFATWSRPVAVSLLLHAILIMLLTHQFSNSGPNGNQTQTISVELLSQTPAPANKKRVQKERTILALKAPDESVTKEQEPVADYTQAEPETTSSTQEQTSPQPDSVSADNQPPGLHIQPLDKLSRQPAFLRKIEPVYPGSERRAGSQAQVIAEVTIDESGKVKNIKIVKSAGTDFDNAVIEALNKSMFTPGYINREAVAVRVLIPFRFNLK